MAWCSNGFEAFEVRARFLSLIRRKVNERQEARFLGNRALSVTSTPLKIELMFLERGLSQSSGLQRQTYQGEGSELPSCFSYQRVYVPISHFFIVSFLSSYQTLEPSGLKVTIFSIFPSFSTQADIHPDLDA